MFIIFHTIKLHALFGQSSAMVQNLNYILTHGEGSSPKTNKNALLEEHNITVAS